MTEKQQEALCKILQDSGYRGWQPDPGAIGGGVELIRGGKHVYRVSREYGRVVILKPDGVSSTAGIRGTITGRGWLPMFASELMAFLARQGEPRRTS